MPALTIRYQRRRSLAIAVGEWNPWGDMAAVQTHLDALAARRWSNHAIATATGVAESTIRRIRNGQANGVYACTAKTILALQPHHWPTKHRRSAVGYARRLQALADQGHGLPTVAAETGLDKHWLGEIRSGQVATVTARPGALIAAAYERLRNQSPPSGRSASRVRAGARRHGWHPHSAWSRYTIDDPGARPRETTNAA
ncbi:hypothetical protein [Nocardiopsis sp. NRRL B-16309]|uniref:hypothetical protein n=1 Tax=Nocardiopsis sp. NRRL B-16309 TaxID=1519494 RepID=UPI000A577D48|nr:hypothetical protein [Nocardiopsis sp. NRRL B-16309]